MNLQMKLLKPVSEELFESLCNNKVYNNKTIMTMNRFKPQLNDLLLISIQSQLHTDLTNLLTIELIYAIRK